MAAATAAAAAPTRPNVAPTQAPIFIDFTVQPEGETSENLDALAKKIAGIDNLGDLIVTELENSASEDGEELDFEKEIEPWLGEQGGLFLQEYEDSDFEGYGAAVQTTDEDEARDFVDKQVESGDEEATDGSYEGVDFKVQEDETTIGVFDGLVVFAEDEAIFKSMVDASDGESLGGEAAYTDAVADVPGESAADVYVDIGALIEESGDEIDDETQLFLDTVGIEPDEATAVASLVPGSDQIEIDLSTDLSGDNPPSGDASELLGSLPATSVGAFASAEFGKRFNEAIDRIDKEGIPGEVPPNQLKKTLKQAGIDLESIASSIGDVGVYVTGNSESSLGGAMVLESESAKRGEEHGLQPRPLPSLDGHSGRHQDQRRGERLLGPQPRTRSPAGRRRRQGQPHRDRLRPRADADRLRGSGQDARRRAAIQGSRRRPRQHPDRDVRRRPLRPAVSPRRWSRRAKKNSKKPSRTWRRSTTWRSGPKPPTIWRPPS